MKDEPQDLRQLLSRLPDVPVPSNFTARALQAVELEEWQAARTRGWQWNWHALLPRFAVTMAVLVFAGIALHRHEIDSRRAEMAKSIMFVAQAQPRVPSVDALQNFDAIRRMSQPVHADEGLLALAPDLK